MREMKLTSKECSNCGETKPISEFKFSKSSGMYYGHCFKCYTDNKERYSVPTVCIPVSQFNELTKAAETLAAIQELVK